MFGNFFGGGGGGWSEAEYQAYLDKMARERQERINRMKNEQRAVEQAPDEATRLALQRRRYKCGDNFITLKDIPHWPVIAPKLAERATSNPSSQQQQSGSNNRDDFGGGGFSWMRKPALTFDNADKQARFAVDEQLNAKIGLIRGDITSLEIDAIVNAANSSLLGGGGVDGAIHSAAGPLLEDECRPLGGCETGNTKITKGFALPAKYVLHTVGPIERGDRQMRRCYRTCLDLCLENNIKTVAFCGIGTGIYGFPLKRASHIALDETRKFLESIKNGTYKSVAQEEAEKKAAATAAAKAAEAEANNGKNDDDSNSQQQSPAPAPAPAAAGPKPSLDSIERIIFCVFTAEELQCYEGLIPAYFPIEGFPAERYVPGKDHDDFNRDDAREWGSSYGGGSGGMGNMGGMASALGGAGGVSAANGNSAVGGGSTGGAVGSVQFH